MFPVDASSEALTEYRASKFLGQELRWLSRIAKQRQTHDVLVPNGFLAGRGDPAVAGSRASFRRAFSLDERIAACCRETCRRRYTAVLSAAARCVCRESPGLCQLRPRRLSVCRRSQRRDRDPIRQFDREPLPRHADPDGSRDALARVAAPQGGRGEAIDLKLARRARCSTLSLDSAPGRMILAVPWIRMRSHAR